MRENKIKGFNKNQATSLNCKWLAIGLLITLFLSACGRQKVTGNDVLTGNPGISGIIYDENGNPAGNAEVLLIPSEFNPAQGQELDTLADTTDAEGQYSFDIQASGTYNLEVRHIENHTRLLVQAIEVDVENTYSISDTLKPSSSIVLPVPDGFRVANSYVYIPGTTFLKPFQDTANYVMLDSVPEGELTIVFITIPVEPQPIPVVYVDTVKAAPADTIRYPKYYAWNYSKKFRLNTTGSGSGNLMNVFDFPVLLRFDNSNFDFSQAEPDGSDLRFSKTGEDFLSYEIERWDPDAEKGEVWLLMDTVHANTDTQSITVFWGNPKAVSLSSPETVFDTSLGFGAVYHLNEDPTGDIAQVFKDRTFNQLHASPTGGMKKSNNVDGVIGKALKLEKDWQGIFPASPDPGLFHSENSSFSMSGWVSVDTTGPDTGVIIDIGGTKFGYALTYIKESKKILFQISEDVNVVTTLESKSEFNHNTPKHIYAQFFSGTMTLYVNGKEEVSDSLGKIVPYHVDGPGIGIIAEKSFAQDPLIAPFLGTLDELRFSTQVRQHRWIRLSYNNQRKDQKFVIW